MLGADKTAPVPFAWWMSRLCEEFHCLPSQAYAEWERLQETEWSGLLEDIIEARSYAGAKRIIDGAETAEARKRIPNEPIFNLVEEIEFELARGEVDEGNHGASDDD